MESKMNKIMFALPMLVTFSVPAMAGDNSCNGTLLVGKDQSVIVSTNTSELVDGHSLRGKENMPTTLQNTSICIFDTKSAVGQKILKVCKNGASCAVSMPLEYQGDGASNRSEYIITDNANKKRSKLIEDTDFVKIKIIESVNK
jgi:hypothetical protein